VADSERISRRELLDRMAANLERIKPSYGRLGKAKIRRERLLAQYDWRRDRRTALVFDEMEPTSKNASAAHQIALQKNILRWMTQNRRRPFRGPIAMRLQVTTTKRDPPQAYTIAKNLLDLFSRPVAGLVTGRQRLLYVDDSQVQALSVYCQHGGPASDPDISLELRPMRDFTDDLSLVALLHDSQDFEFEHDDSEFLDEARSRFKSAKASSDSPLPDDNFIRTMAQRDWFEMAEMEPYQLAQLYEAVSYPWDKSGVNVAMFKKSPLRICFDELPQKPGSGSAWKADLEEQMRDYYEKSKWLLAELKVPVAIIVVVKPPPPSRRMGLNDLDNVMRTYIAPRVIQTFSPISDAAFLAPDNSPWGTVWPMPPKVTKVGINRYEVWRLPPATENERGFVALTIVSNETLTRDTFRAIDDDIERWRRKKSRR
jgi:hypothetical protein